MVIFTNVSVDDFLTYEILLVHRLNKFQVVFNFRLYLKYQPKVSCVHPSHLNQFVSVQCNFSRTGSAFIDSLDS